MTVAHELLAKLRPVRIKGINAGIPRKSADKLLHELADHIKWLKSRHVTKAYDDAYIVGWCYGKMRTLKTDSERNAYCRSHLCLADKCFDNLLTELKDGGEKISYKSAKAHAEIITDYIFDLQPIAEYLERKSNPGYVFIRGGRYFSVHTNELFRLSRQLAVQSAYRSNALHIDHKSAQIVAVFALRQALEEKFVRLIAVHFYDASGATPKLKHFFHYDFIVQNATYFEFKSVDFKILKKVYELCNEVVHNVYQPMAWQLAYAHNLCGGLFYTISVPSGSRWNINNAVEINNLDKMQDAFVDHFNSYYQHGIWSVDKQKPEAMLV